MENPNNKHHVIDTQEACVLTLLGVNKLQENKAHKCGRRTNLCHAVLATSLSILPKLSLLLLLLHTHTDRRILVWERRGVAVSASVAEASVR